MLNYLKSDCYRVVREKTIYIYAIAFAGIVIAAALVLAGVAKAAGTDFPYANTRFLFLNIQTTCGAAVMAFYFLENMIIGEEIQHKTLKNSVSYGISRGKIFWEKFLLGVLIVIPIALVVIGCSVASGYLLLEHSEIWYLESLLKVLVGCFPLALATIALYHVLMLLCESMNMTLGVFATVYVVIPMISRWLGLRYEVFAKIYRYSPYGLMTETQRMEDGRVLMGGNTPEGMMTCWAVGISLTAVTLLIGYILFQKKEIK